jgi:alpha-glucosidase (family GH31 glycosyl hydrolase)
MDIFIGDNQGHPFIGKVWPGLVNFPDFTNPAAFQYWFEMISTFHETAPFDGLCKNFLGIFLIQYRDRYE